MIKQSGLSKILKPLGTSLPRMWCCRPNSILRGRRFTWRRSPPLPLNERYRDVSPITSANVAFATPKSLKFIPCLTRLGPRNGTNASLANARREARFWRSSRNPITTNRCYRKFAPSVRPQSGLLSVMGMQQLDVTRRAKKAFEAPHGLAQHCLEAKDNPGRHT
jgi:hypothetical protein